MEMKLSHRNNYYLSKSFLSNTETSFRSHTFCLKSWAATERHRFKGLVKKWRLQNNKKDYHCAHVFLNCRGENLFSISKMYGVSVNSIAAANEEIVDIDLVFKGQLLNIPAPSLFQTKLEKAKKSRLWVSISAMKCHSQQKLHTILTSYGLLSKAKTTGYFLVLVPLVAFCIGCVISIFCIRVARDIRNRAVGKSQRHHPGVKSIRWKSVLGDAAEGDVLDSELRVDSNNPSEDEAYNTSYEDAAHAYHRLQNDYQKFLSECGISEWGYWRGGSPGD